MAEYDIHHIARHLDLPGDFLGAEPYGSGHINDTYRATYREAGKTVYYILQRINHDVFKQPIPLMDNVDRITRHQREKLQAGGVTDLDRRALRVIPATDGLSYYQDDDGNIWRAYVFITRAQTYDFLEDPQQAFQAGKAFGGFQLQLSDLPGERLVETIPNFHHTPKRFETFAAAVAEDRMNRARLARPEIAFAMAQEAMTRHLIDCYKDGRMPERITHNDTKINNVMLDDETGEGICIIDLDTTMPGLIPYDFGDMVRTYTSPTEEDERDLSKIHIEMALFKNLAEGYLASAHTFLTEAERENLVFGGKLMTFENGIRFLTDFLQGDVYYKIHREGHNLDRCRTQFKLVALIAEQEAALNEIVAAWSPDV